MTESTASLVVEMRVRDLVSKSLTGVNAKLAAISKTGGTAFKGLARGIANFASTGLRQITRFADQARRKLTALGKLTILGGAAATIGFGQSFAREFAAFEEDASKFRAVFKETAASAVQDLNRISAQTGISRVELTRYFSSLQDTFVPLGVAIDDAAQLSAKVTQLGIDLASFNNKSTEDTLRDLQSALVGNAETVRKYGIVITEAGLKQEAYRLGLARSGQELTEQIKLQARLSLLFRGSVDAQGDAQRTLDSTTNVFKRLRSEYTELKVIFGREIISRVRELIDNLGGVEGVMNKVALGMSIVTKGANALIDALGGLGGVTDTLMGNFTDTDGITSLLSGRFARMRDEAVNAARESEKLYKALGGTASLAGGLGIADQVAEEYDSIPRDLKNILGLRLKLALQVLGVVAKNGAKFVGQNIKLGILQGLDGLTIDVPFGRDFTLDVSDQIEATTQSIERSQKIVSNGVRTLGSIYQDATSDVQAASNRISALVGRSGEDILDQLIPDEQDKNRVAAEYADLGFLINKTISNGQNRQTAQGFADLGISLARTAISAQSQYIQAQQQAALVAVQAAQTGLVQVIASPALLNDFGKAARDQWQAYEDSFLNSIATSGIPTRVEQFMQAQVARLEEQAKGEFFKAGRVAFDSAGNPTKAFIDRMRDLEAAFQSSGKAAREAFKLGVADAIDAISRFADQAAQAGQDVVFGFRDAISGGLFAGFTSEADRAGEAWETFRSRFKNVLAQIVSDILASRITKLLASLFGGPSAAQATVLNTVFGTSFAHGGVMKGEMGKPVPVRAYAEGGIARSPQLALFGEGRGAEAFVPLKNGSIPVEVNGGASGTNVSVNLTVNSLDPRTAGSVILEQMPTIRAALADALQSGQDRNLRIAIQGAK